MCSSPLCHFFLCSYCRLGDMGKGSLVLCVTSEVSPLIPADLHQLRTYSLNDLKINNLKILPVEKTGRKPLAHFNTCHMSPSSSKENNNQIN